MKKEDGKQLFIKTLKLGESMLSLSFYDYEDAYSYSEENFSETSRHFIEHFTEHSDEPKGTYEKDVVRYNYIKAIEHRISSDIYSKTSRGNMCDVLRSPFDIHLAKYPMNLPKHLENIINGFQDEAERFSSRVISDILPCNDRNLCYEMLNAVQFLGQAFGYHIGQENQQYKGYNCCDLLTRDEINIVAGTNLCKWLAQNGYDIEAASYTREPCLSVSATKDEQNVLIVFSAEIAPIVPGFIEEDLDEIYDLAKHWNAIPYFACINIGSCNKKHFDDGVILSGDSMKYSVSAFDVLEKDQ